MIGENGPGKDGQAVPPEFEQLVRKLWELASGLAADESERELGELRRRLAGVEPELESLRAERDSLLESREVQGQALSERERQLHALKQKLDDALSSGGAAKRQLEDRERALQEARKSIEQLEGRLAELEQNSGDVAAREQAIREEYEAKLQAEKARNEGVHQQLADRERQIDEASTAMQRMEAKLRESHEAVEQAVAQQQQLQAELERARDAGDGLSMPPQELQAEFNRASSKLEVITAERDRTERDLEDALKTIDESRELLKKKDAMIAALQAEEHSADAQRVNKLENELAVLRRKMDIVNREANALAEKNASLLKELEVARS